MTIMMAGSFDQINSAKIFAERERDWRNGNVVYQVLVDRFAPSDRLDAKRELYPAPKVLRGWSEMPRPGIFILSASRDHKSLCLHRMTRS